MNHVWAEQETTTNHMKEGKMKKRHLCFITATVLLVTALVLVSKEVPAQANPVTLKMVQVFPKGQTNMFIVPIFIKLVEQKSKGELQIKLLGGPEAIPTFNQWDAVKSGVVDLNFNVAAYYYRKGVPEAMLTWLSKAQSPMEERKTGFYDLMNQLHQKAGVYYLGRGQWSSFYLWPNKKIQTSGDLSGLKMRSGLIYDAFLKALGAVPVTIAYPEVYTALERGLADGFCWTMEGVPESGWLEVTKNCIDHPFYSGDFVFLANLKSFNNLPKHLQRVLIDASKELEPKMVNMFQDLDRKERKKAEKAGVNFIHFSKKNAETYVDTAWKAGYMEAKKICRPEYFEKLMKMAGW